MSTSLNRNTPGFTLIEVLITLVIIAIVAGLTAPAIMTMAPNMALKSTAQDVLSNVQEAKVLAVKENRDVTLRFDTPGIFYLDDDGDTNFDGACCGCAGAEPCVLLGEDLNGNGALDAGEDFNGNGRLDTNYYIGYGTGATADDWLGTPCVQLEALTFNSRGLPTLTAAAPPPAPSTPNIYVQNQEGIAYAIAVSVAGSVSIRKHDGTNWD